MVTKPVLPILLRSECLSECKSTYCTGTEAGSEFMGQTNF